MTYFFIISAEPDAGTDDKGIYAGADVACWIADPDIFLARNKAISMINNSGWKVIQIAEEKAIARSDCPEDSLQYYDQAQVDGEVCVFYTFPISEQPLS